MAGNKKGQRGTLRAVLVCAAIAAALAVWMLWGNLTVGATHFDIASDRLPEAFEGFRIAHISDLHNAEYGEDNSRIVELLRREKPDIIAVTGDLVDVRHTDIDVAAELMERLTGIAPCYYVTGNHEAALGRSFAKLEQRLTEAGVTVLRCEVVRIQRDGASIELIGLDDPDFTSRSVSQWTVLDRKLKELDSGDGFRLLLSHRPETFSTYAANGIDLALCGHAHGGQFRLPFIGGIFAPDQGFLPEYDAGVYREGRTAMIVSRGLGNSAFPVRLNNRPEIVIAQLHTAAS